MAQPAQAHLRGLPQKRSRSWEVDVSLEELVSWDVLDQFMGDMPAEPIHVPEQRVDVPVGVAMLPPPASSAAPSWPAGPSTSAAPEAVTSHPNAATLAQSLYSGWQQGGTVPWQGALGFGAMSWGTEFLSGTLAGEDASMVSGDLDGPDGGDDSPVQTPTSSNDRAVHKQRFVWTAELHRRFEAAVNTLGIDHAKPQAISQLMNCEGEGAPTRQNIKSHLQKYRLLMQKRARQQATQAESAPGPSSAGDGTVRPRMQQSNVGSMMQQPTDVQGELEQHLARQEMNLKVQMELQTKLHRQLLVQRQLQHQLEHTFSSPGELQGIEAARWQATLALKNNLRERLTKHVVMQQEMLHHLDALVSSEVSKAPGEKAESNEGIPQAPQAAGATEQPAT